MNPFVKTSAGLFAIVSPKNIPSGLAQKICAALASKIRTEQKNTVDSVIWQESVSNIPNLIDVKAGSKQLTTLAKGNLVAQPIAKLAAGLISDSGTASKVEQGVSNYLTRLPIVNSFVLLLMEQDTQKIDLHLLDTMTVETSRNTVLDVSSASFSLDTSISKNLAELESIFNSFEPLSNQPYYLSISA